MVRASYMITFGRKPRRRKGFVRQTGMSPRKQAYLAYIRSPAWRAFREAWWTEYDRRNPVRACYCCSRTRTELTRPLELHHRTYEHLGAERYEDIVCVCRACHAWITRRQRNRSVTQTIWQITEARRTMMHLYYAKRKGSAGGR